MTKIISESSKHFKAVRQLTTAAFAASMFGHNGEAELIETIRAESKDALSLVAIDFDDCVVGHILFSPAMIRIGDSTFHGMGLGPMAVLPSHQRRGIGTLLVQEGLQRLAQANIDFTLVAGHVDFYPRFGFIPAQNFSISHGFADMPQDILHIVAREEALLAKMRGGLAYYHPAFGSQHVV